MDVIVFLRIVFLLSVLFAMFYAGVYLPTKREEKELEKLQAEVKRLTDRDNRGRFVRKEPK